MRTNVRRLLRGARWVPAALTVSVGAVLGGCHAKLAHAGSTADSAKTVVVHNTDTGRWSAATAWHVRRTLRIGSDQASGPDVFGRVEGLAVSPDGAIYALDAQAHEIREFDSHGHWIRTFGREGHGPGELANASGMDWGPYGTLWVMDPGNTRLSVFDTAGTALGSHLVRAGYTLAPWVGRLDTRGRLTDVGMRYDHPPGTAVLVQDDSAFVPRDTIELPAFQAQRYTVNNAAGLPLMSMPVPFTPALEWTLDAHDHLWFAITSTYRITEVGLNGDTLLEFDKRASPIPVTEPERDEAVASLKKMAGDAPIKIDPSRIPSTKAPIGPFLVDGDGDVWVMPATPAGDTSHVADVFDPSGHYLGAVTLPGAPVLYPRPAITHDAIYTVQRDSLGVNYVERWTITRREEDAR